ncbi:MAG: protein-export chaperone SecB [Dongiaceae bacterium]
MTDAPTTPAPEAPPPPAAAAAAPITVVTQYVKDLSFENPNAPAVLANATEAPHGNVQVDVQVRPLGASNFEVSLTLRAETRQKDQLAYLVELVYAGLFVIGDVPPERIEPLIMVEAPRFLFPFARAIVMALTRDGGYAPLLINPIDFAVLYRDHRQRLAQQPAAPAAS